MTGFSGSLLAGARLGPYEIIDALGAGGMGQVYRARDTRLGRIVAVKVLPADSASVRELRDRFEREARAISNLEHPNICPLYDVGVQGDLHYLVMQYLEGHTLDARVRQEPLAFGELLTLAREIAMALAYAHKYGVVHRDLKPTNVMLTATGAKLLDFGLATRPPPASDESTRADALITKDGSMPGTVAYMAPETLVGRASDVRSDIWSLGVTLYVAATGHLPFQGRTSYELTSSIIRDDAPTLSEGMSPRLRAIIGRCLEKDPERRYQSAAEIVDDLGRVSAGDAATSRGVSRRTAIATIAVAGAAAAVMFVLRTMRPAVSDTSPPTAHAAGVAVLPLANLSANENEEYVADGMTEAIITELGRIRSLRVISRQSVMRYKRTTEPLPQIAKELGVDAVVTGSVTREDDRLRVTVSLVQVSPERQLWSGVYDRTVGDMLTLSSQVAQDTLTHVSATVTPQERERLARARPVDSAAQQAYLLGRFYWNKRTKADIERAVQEFTRAITLDPNAALAYAGLADCYVVSWDNGSMSPELAYRGAKGNAMKALQLDDEIAEAHASLGAVYSFSVLWSAAEQEYQRAMDLNPGYTTAHQWYSINLGALGRHQAAVAEARRALDLDPLSPIQNVFLGRQLYFAGRYGAAIEQLKKTLVLSPDLSVAQDYLGRTYLEQHNFEAALHAFEEGSRLAGSVTGNLGHAYGATGDAAAARRVLRQLLAMAREQYIRPDEIALVYLGLGDREVAVDWLLKAYQEREGVVQDLAIDPRLTPIAGHPRFRSMLQKTGLTFSPGRP